MAQDSSRSLCVSLALAPRHGVRRHLARPRHLVRDLANRVLSCCLLSLPCSGTSTRLPLLTATLCGTPAIKIPLSHCLVSLPRLAASPRRVFLPSYLGVSLSCLVASYAIASLSSVAVLSCDCFLAVLSRCECFCLFVLSRCLVWLPGCLVWLPRCLVSLSRVLSRLAVPFVVPSCCLFLLSFSLSFSLPFSLSFVEYDFDWD